MKFIIYIIECLENNKTYVGITNNINNRWNKHKYDSRNGSNFAIHRAIRKYGLEKFKISVIKECFNKEELLMEEKRFIKIKNSHISKNGYNETWGGDAPMLGRRHSKYSKLKISNKLKGRVSPYKGKKSSSETKEKLSKIHSKPVLKLNINGEIIASYNSITEASNDVGISNSNISGVCRGNRKTAAGFRWKYREVLT